MIERVSRQELREIVAAQHAHISDHDRDEMAIPSYLHGNPLIRWLMWRRYEVIAELSGINEQHVVCEFGCGTGMFLPELSRRSGNVFAIDLFPEYARALCLARQLPVSFVDTIDALEDDSLDLLIAADVLEHITDLNPYLERFQAKLKENGRFVVSGPTENFVYRIGRFVAGFSGKGDYHHTNIHDLVEAITRFGFRPVDSRNLPFSLPPHLFNVTVFDAPSGAAPGA